MGSISACVLYLNLELWTKDSKIYNQLANVTASILYAFSPLIWRYSIDGEIFSMNNLFNNLLIHQSLRVGIYHKKKDVRIGAFLCGFFMTNQQTILFYEVPLILWILYMFRNETTFLDLIIYGVLFCIGLLPYFYLLIADRYFPKPFVFGGTSTYEGLLYHILRKAYGTFQLSPSDAANNESIK